MAKPVARSIPVGRRAHANAYVGFLNSIGVPVERGLEAAKLPIEQTGGDAIVTADSIRPTIRRRSGNNWRRAAKAFWRPSR